MTQPRTSKDSKDVCTYCVGMQFAQVQSRDFYELHGSWILASRALRDEAAMRSPTQPYLLRTYICSPVMRFAPWEKQSTPEPELFVQQLAVTPAEGSRARRVES